MIKKYYHTIFLLFVSLLIDLHGGNLLQYKTPGGNIWPHSGCEIKTNADGSLDITVPKGAVCNGSIALKPEWKLLRLVMEMKATDLVPGSEGWQRGRISMAFYDANHKQVGGWPPMFETSGTTEWTRCERVYSIPAGAVQLAIDPSMYGQSGTIAFRNLTVKAYRSREECDTDFSGPALPARSILWNLDGAERHTNAARDSICLNTVWQFLPVKQLSSAELPADDTPEWRYFKVPGVWPGSGGWDAPGSVQLIFRADGAPDGTIDGKSINHAWYRRTIEIPDSWQGRKIELGFDFIQTCAQVFVNGRKCGDVYYPGGAVDVTGAARPGSTNEIALLVSARVEESESKAFMAPGRIITSRGQLPCRGIPGDIRLTAYSSSGRLLTDTHVITSVSKGVITFDTGFAAPIPANHTLRAEIFDGETPVKMFHSGSLKAAKAGERRNFSGSWQNAKLWDIDSPQNLYRVRLSLLNADGNIVDQIDDTFGFREFTIRGRDFYLNGRKIHLRSMVGMNTKRGADESTEEMYRIMAERARDFGINHLIGTNYNFAPGSISFLELFHRETSKQGILTTLSLPHVMHFKWKLDEPEFRDAYRRQAEYLIRRFQNVPGVVLYVANHNATGYFGDQNPLKIDGIYSPDGEMRKLQPGQYERRRQALLSAEIIHSLDPTRPLYHHESGNLSDLYSINCYLNWAPRQERSDWFAHWSETGKKPLFLLEWGMPHVCSWSSYRGPAFIWASEGLQCLWFNEYNAAILGEEAYRFDWQKANMMRHQEKVITGNKPVHFSTLNWFGKEPDTQKVWSYFILDNFRSMRAHGVSGLLPWDQDAFWIQRGAGTSADNPKRFENIKRSGVVPDRFGARPEYFNNRSNSVELLPLGKLCRELFQPETGWIGGRPEAFTEKNRNFRPGEQVEKSLILVNDARQVRNVNWLWRVDALNLKHSGSAEVAPGETLRIPVKFTIPESCREKSLELTAEMAFPSQTVHDSITLQLLPAPSLHLQSRVALFDPEGSAAPLLEKLGVKTVRMKSGEPLPSGTGILVIGRNALSKLRIDLSSSLQHGLRLLILEQPLTECNKLGLRGNEQLFREVFPIAGGISETLVHDWRGESTLLPAYLTVPTLETKDPLWSWNGFANFRVWRAGNRGAVVSVPLEKPCIGDWMPLLQSGFDLQYAPVLEFREDKARIIFSQLDLSGRTEPEPEAEQLLQKLLERLDTPVTKQTGKPKLFVQGGPELHKLLNMLKITVSTGEAASGELLVIDDSAEMDSVAAYAEAGGTVLAFGLKKESIDSLTGGKLAVKTEKGYADFAPGLNLSPEFAGISNADLHFRRELELAFFPAASSGGKTLAVYPLGKGKIVFCQVTPDLFPESEFMYRTTRRRAFFLASRLLHNLGAQSTSGLLEKFRGKTNHQEGVIDLSSGWLGKADPKQIGRRENWQSPDYKPGPEWRGIEVPGMFDLQFEDLHGYDGHFWYRKTFDLESELPANTECKLYFGGIDDESWIWLNGEFLGEVTMKSNPNDFWAADRIYTLKTDKIKPKGNLLVVLVNDRQQNGGILGKPNLNCLPAYRLYVDQPIAEDDPYRYYRW